MSRVVVLGGGESGVGSAVLAKVKGFDVFPYQNQHLAVDTSALIICNIRNFTQHLLLNSDRNTFYSQKNHLK